MQYYIIKTCEREKKRGSRQLLESSTVRVMMSKATFILYRGAQFYSLNLGINRRKPPDLPQVTDKLLPSHNDAFSTILHEWDSNPRLEWCYCIGSCKSNYHTITTRTAA